MSFATARSLSPAKLVLAISTGGFLEYFDFSVFALFLPYISKVFFPAQSGISALLNSMLIFVVGYFARPLGGLIIAHFGDARSRKDSLLWSVGIMALTTLLTGLLPGYSQVGWLAPILLIMVRLFQGAAIGGEVPGVITYLVEYFSATSPLPSIGIALASATFGNVASGFLAYALTKYIPHDAFVVWGWRLPFLFGSFLGLIALIIRKRFQETIVFTKLLRSHHTCRFPALSLLKNYFPQTIIAAGFTAAVAVTTFSLLYLPTFKRSVEHATVVPAYSRIMISFVVISICTAIFGYLARFIKAIYIVMAACFIVILLAISCCLASKTLNDFSWQLILISIAIGMINSSYIYLMAKIFPMPIRYSGLALSYNIGIAFFAAITPLFLTVTYRYFNNDNVFFSLLIVASSITLMSLLAYWLLNKKILLELPAAHFAEGAMT